MLSLPVSQILKLKLFSWGQVKSFKSNTSQPDIPAICGYTGVWVVKNATKRRPNLSNGINYGRVHISWHIARSCLQNVAFPHTWCRLHRLHRIGFSFPESSRYQISSKKTKAPWEKKKVPVNMNFKKRGSFQYSINIAPWCRCLLHILSAKFEHHCSILLHDHRIRTMLYFRYVRRHAFE